MLFTGLGYQRIKDFVSIDLRSNLVIKYCPTKQLDSSSANRYQFRHVQSELTLVPALDHPHIIKFQHILYDANNTPYAIVMPRADYDFQDVIEHPQLNVRSLPQHFRKILQAVQYLHEQDIAHLDIRSSNVLLFGNEPVLADFGYACKYPYFQSVSEFIEKWIRVKEEWQGPELYQIFANLNENILPKKVVRKMYENGNFENLPPQIRDEPFQPHYFDTKKHDVFQLGLMLWYWLIFSNHCLCQVQRADSRLEEALSTATSNNRPAAQRNVDLPSYWFQPNSADEFMELEDRQQNDLVAAAVTPAENVNNCKMAAQQVKKETVKIKVDKRAIFVRCSPYTLRPTADDETYKLFLEHDYNAIYQHFLKNIIKDQWLDQQMQLQSLLNLICCCFQLDPSKRPSVQELAQHPWVNLEI